MDDDWSIAGSIVRIAGGGPDESTALYYPGNGGASGYRNAASFLAEVEPGRTYTFSAYVDSTGHTGQPAYVSLEAANGAWQGANIVQTGKGTVQRTFTIPSACGTTLLRGTFDPHGGVYPVGRGAMFAQPQLEEGDVAHAFSSESDSPLDAPARANLVVDSDALTPDDDWQISGEFRFQPVGGISAGDAAVYDGDGRPSGFGDAAAFFAHVKPGADYIFSIFVNGAPKPETPPYVFLRAVNGSWSGAQLFSSARGREFATFAIPAGSGTTMIRGWVSPQNGVYPDGSMLVAAHPMVEAGALPHAYVAGSASGRPSRNRVIDSAIAAPSIDWQLAGAARVANRGGADRAIDYDGNGAPSGYANSATFFATVSPGKTYTFSASLDGRGHTGTPPYVFLRAANGTWAGAQVYQPGWGVVYESFSIPAGSGTSCIAATATPQNGAYPRGDAMRFSRPQIEAGDTFGDYVPTGPALTTRRAGSAACP